MSFRPSRYVDFESGLVRKPPMELARERRQPWSVGDMLDVFECRVDVWQLGPAVEILKQIESTKDQGPVWAHAAYALLSVGTAYFEMIGKTLNPAAKTKGTAGTDFNFGFCDVYPTFLVSGRDRSDSSVPDVREFRDRLRNGTYHLGYTKNNLLIHYEPARIPEDFFIDRSGTPPLFLVNPHGMIRTIVGHFPSFIGRLRDPEPSFDDLRLRFGEFFTSFHA